MCPLISKLLECITNHMLLKWATALISVKRRHVKCSFVHAALKSPYLLDSYSERLFYDLQGFLVQ